MSYPIMITNIRIKRDVTSKNALVWKIASNQKNEPMTNFRLFMR